MMRIVGILLFVLTLAVLCLAGSDDDPSSATVLHINNVNDFCSITERTTEVHLNIPIDYLKVSCQLQSVNFHGVFEGNNNTISNFGRPLFDKLGGTGGDCKIRDLRFVSPSKREITTSALASEVVGDVDITNVHSSGTVTGNPVAGGLIGKHTGGLLRMSDCSSSGTVSGDPAGGLIGSALQSVVLTRCHNAASIQSSGCSGGLIGKMAASDNNPLVRSDKQKGEIGQCWNKGTVSGNSFVGGIIGHVNNTPVLITHCRNIGTIELNLESGTSSDKQGHYASGIVGLYEKKQSNVVTISFCSNEGNITAAPAIVFIEAFLSGIASVSESQTSYDDDVFIEKSVNSGDLDDYSHAFGIGTLQSASYCDVVSIGKSEPLCGSSILQPSRAGYICSAGSSPRIVDERNGSYFEGEKLLCSVLNGYGYNNLPCWNSNLTLSEGCECEKSVKTFTVKLIPVSRYYNVPEGEVFNDFLRVNDNEMWKEYVLLRQGKDVETEKDLALLGDYRVMEDAEVIAGHSVTLCESNKSETDIAFVEHSKPLKSSAKIVAFFESYNVVTTVRGETVSLSCAVEKNMTLVGTKSSANTTIIYTVAIIPQSWKYQVPAGQSLKEYLSRNHPEILQKYLLLIKVKQSSSGKTSVLTPLVNDTVSSDMEVIAGHSVEVYKRNGNSIDYSLYYIQHDQPLKTVSEIGKMFEFETLYISGRNEKVSADYIVRENLTLSNYMTKTIGISFNVTGDLSSKLVSEMMDELIEMIHDIREDAVISSVTYEANSDGTLTIIVELDEQSADFVIPTFNEYVDVCNGDYMSYQSIL